MRPLGGGNARTVVGTTILSLVSDAFSSEIVTAGAYSGRRFRRGGHGALDVAGPDVRCQPARP